MTSYCGKDFVALLPDFHYDGTDFDWMFQLEKESNVINLMCRYIDTNAILEGHEMESYLEWEANNSFEDMEIPVINKSSTIWGAAEDNKLLDAEIDASENLLNYLPNRAKTTRLLLDSSQEEASKSQHKCEQAQEQCRMAEDGCRTLSSRLIEAYSKTVKDFENSSLLLNCEVNCTAIPRFIVHCPFEEMRNDRERWSNTVRETLTRVMSEALSTEPESNSSFRFIAGGDATSHQRLLKQIAMLVGKLLQVKVDSILKNIDHESTLEAKAALEELLQQIHSGQSIPLNRIEPSRGFDVTCFAKIRAILQRKERDNIVVPLMNKFTEECNSWSAKYCLKISRLREISDLVREQRDLDLLTSIQCQLDKSTVKNMEKLLQCFIGSLPKIEEARRVPNQLEHVVIKRERSASPLPNALPLLRAMPKCTMEVLCRLFPQADGAISSKEEEIIRSIRLLLAYFSQRKDISNNMMNYLTSGATTKPVVIDYNYVTMLQELEREYAKIAKELSVAHSAVEKLENARKQNPGSCTLRLLWVPFMIGNTERLEAIAAGDFSLNTTIKQQFGSHRKREWSSVKKKPIVNKTTVEF